MRFKSENLFFTSDLHLCHRNIIKYSSRPFKETMEMNEAIRDNHNSLCDKDSVIFNLGDAILLPKDFSPSQEITVLGFLKTFKGRINYLPGNHENNIHLIKSAGWIIHPAYLEIKVGEGDDTQHIILCHYSFRTWNKAHYGSWHLYGHSHGGLLDDNRNLMVNTTTSLSLDVGVDTNNFKPYSFEQIKRIMSLRNFKPTDHHVGRAS